MTDKANKLNRFINRYITRDTSRSFDLETLEKIVLKDKDKEVTVGRYTIPQGATHIWFEKKEGLTYFVYEINE